ncbi:hypothetical protein, partial [Pseudomonas sp. UYEF17]|uniref:hypothetical protein n=1 Tax=Pseudomonas sp. UYEF17 TaxID=1756403 RepID=UPI00339779DC
EPPCAAKRPVQATDRLCQYRPLRSTRLLLQNLAKPMSHVLFYESGHAREEAGIAINKIT